MKFLLLRETEKYKVEICFVNLAILFYLFRTAIPVFKYPFLLFFFGLLVYSVLTYRNRIITAFIEFIRNYYLLLFLALTLVVSFILSNKIYLTIFKDVVNMVILVSIFAMSTHFVAGKKELDFFVSNIVYLIVLFASVTSIISLLDLLNIFFYDNFSLNTEITGGSSDASLYVDINFALLPVFFGMIGVFYNLRNNNSKLQIIYYNVLLIIFSLNIILSGSRRGLFTFIAIMALLSIAQIFTFFKKKTFLRRLGSDSKYFILSFFLLVILSSYLAFYTDYAIKIKVLEFIGSKNLPDTKLNITLKMYKYSLIFGNHRPFPEFYSRIWPTVPEDPDSGWGTKVHKTIFPLTGKNVEIVPNGSKGYLMDSTCNAAYYTTTDVSESYTLVVYLNAGKGDRYKASVYCFVSDTFDIDVANLTVKSSCISNKLVSGKVTDLYNLERKGVWQKLEVEFDCNEGEIPVLMSFWKKGVKDFRKLNGYVIFAYPQYEKINKTDTVLSHSVTQSKINYLESGIIELTKAHSTVIRHSKIPSITFALNKQNYFSSGIFYLPLSFLIASGSIRNDNDPVRYWASKFISEDTTYYPYKANIVLDKISNSFIGDRISRWEFALKIFTKEYNWSKKIFGGGFNFLNWYGYYFLKDKTESDWPHNPFLSILLYSGIVGLLIYSFFLYKVFYYYLKYVRQYPILLTFFIITFFFAFFSGGSPFDPPIMGFFVILPFFIHSVHKKMLS